MLKYVIKAWLVLPVLSSFSGFAQEVEPAKLDLSYPHQDQNGSGRDLFFDRTGQSGMIRPGYNEMEQQQLWIEGKVTDAETGEVMAGATIYFKGLFAGIVTNADGYFTIPVPVETRQIYVSFPGYFTQVIDVGQVTRYNIQLVREETLPFTWVETGYMKERRRDIIGSVAIVNTSEMLEAFSANAAVQLQGRVAGVNISDVGAVDGSPRVRIRGFSTLGGAEPLYVVDGLPVEVDELNSFDIASVQVLKGGAATSLFGARGGNGVLVMTTREGVSGKPRVDLDYRYGISYVSKSDFPDLLNAEEMGELYWLQMKGAGREFGEVNWTHSQYGNGPEPVIPEYILVNYNGSRTGGTELEAMRISDPDRFAWYTDPLNYDFYTHQIVRSGNTDWFDELYDPASVQQLQLTASGGKQRLNYYLSAGYFDRNHVSDRYSFFTRYSLRSNASYQGRRLKIGEHIQLFYSESRNAGNGNAWNMPSLCPVYDIAGNPASSAAPGIIGMGDGNPVTNAWRNRFDGTFLYSVLGNVYAEISLLEHIGFRTSLGIEYLNRIDKDYTMPTYEHAENVSPPARLLKNWGDRSNWIFTNTLRYERTAGKHRLNLMTGTETIRKYVASYTGSRSAPEIDDNPYTIPLDPTRSGNTVTFSWLSFFGRLDYSYGDKYLVGLSLRRDKTNEIIAGRSIGYFPSAELGWRISGEEFMNRISWLDELKLRLSYGMAGNINTTLEQISAMNVGFDVGLFYDRHADLILNVDYYIRRSEDLLVFEPEPFRPVINTGQMINRGIEFTLSKKGNIGGIIEYEVAGSFSSYRNEVIRLTDNEAITVSGGGTRMGSVSLTKAGYPIAVFYGYRIEGFFNNQQEVDAYQSVYTSTWLPPSVGRWRIKDVNGDHVIDDYDKVRMGDPHPDFQLGLTFKMDYRDFDLSCFIHWSQGGEVFNLIRYNVDFNTFHFNRSARMLYDAWTPDHTGARLPKADLNDAYSYKYATDYFVEDATFIRLKQIQLGYSFRPEWLNRILISRLRIFVQGDNLWTGLKGFSGLDPVLGAADESDLSMGIYRGTTPVPKQISFGLDIGL